MNRQQVRKALLLISFAILPVTLFYISPIIPLMGASEGIITGSLILYLTFFFISLIAGRIWCGWFCPMGGFQELCTEVQNKPVTGGRLNLIKYGVWALWIFILLSIVVSVGGIHAINILYGTNLGISLIEPFTYGIYFIILGGTFLLAIFAGKRGMCHYICPMCVNFIIGRKIQGLFGWSSLHLTGDSTRCTGCNKCSKACPMGLDVMKKVREDRMEDIECILCASCSDICPKNAISYGFQR